MIVLLFLATQPVSAEIIVLVHGYHSSGATWRTSGIMTSLHAHGWQDAGDYFLTPAGAMHNRPAIPATNHLAVTIDLPSEAPIFVQAGHFKHYLDRIRQDYPDQQLIIVAHSAGGVVARYHLVRQPENSVIALLSLASPHLGTASAELGALASNSPVGAVAPFVGMDSINRSEDLFDDLQRERYGSMLHWLNRQPHPEIRWISLVRGGAYTGTGRFIVPGHSQDLRNVVALQHRAMSFIVPGDHELNIRDGDLIANIISNNVFNQTR
jgi:triacylglycerol lipase